MTPTSLADLEDIRGTLLSIVYDLISINNEDPRQRELSIAQLHCSEAIKALNLFLNGKPTNYSDPVTAAEVTAFLSELNSGTDS